MSDEISSIKVLNKEVCNEQAFHVGSTSCYIAGKSKKHPCNKISRIYAKDELLLITKI